MHAYLQVQHHVRGLSDALPHLTYLLIVHGLLGVQTSGDGSSASSPPAPTPVHRGQQLMAALASAELPKGPGAQASLLHLTTRQFHVGAAVREALNQVHPCCALHASRLMSCS